MSNENAFGQKLLATLGSESVEVQGTNFGSEFGSVTMDGMPCQITSWTHSSIQFTTVEGAGKNVKVDIKTKFGTNVITGLETRYKLPVITNFSPSYMPTTGGTVRVHAKFYHPSST